MFPAIIVNSNVSGLILSRAIVGYSPEVIVTCDGEYFYASDGWGFAFNQNQLMNEYERATATEL